MPKHSRPARRQTIQSNTYRFFVDSSAIHGRDVLLEDGELAHQIGTVLRLRPGEKITLLDSATRQGSRALGFDADYGTIEPGKRSRLLAVALPAATDDVEEYLVGGITPDQVWWVD